MAALTTVSEVKQLLRMAPTTTTDDALIQRLVLGASQAFRSALNRDIVSSSYTETRNGTGTNTLVLKNAPVTAVTSLQIGAPNVARSALVLNTDFVFGETAIQLLGGCFPRGIATVAVTYVAGYVVVPWDLTVACAKVAALRYKELDRLGQRSMVLQQQTVNYDLSDFPPDVKTVLNNYRRVAPV